MRIPSAPPPGRRRPALAVAWLLCAVALSSCSMPRLAYNQADWFLLRQVNSYLDLSDDQEGRAKEALAVAHRRHRESVLPGFADAFADAAARIRGGLTAADMRELMGTGQTLLAASLDEVLPPVSEALTGLSAEQRAHLAKRLEERNAEYVENHWLDRPAAERRERRAARTVSRIEDWTGPLNADQVALVESLRDAMPDDADAWLAHRRSQQRTLLALIDAGAPAADVEAFLRDWWSMRDALPAALARSRELRTRSYVELVVRLAATLDSVQREHLLDRLDELARDARELAVET